MPIASPTRARLNRSMGWILPSACHRRGARAATTAFIGSLSVEQKAETMFAADHEEWRDWQNIHRYARKGVNFKAMSAAQRERAFGLLAAS